MVLNGSQVSNRPYQVFSTRDKYCTWMYGLFEVDALRSESGKNILDF